MLQVLCLVSATHTNNYMYIDNVKKYVSVLDIKSKLTSLGITNVANENSDEKIKLIGMNNLSNIHHP